jgi:hypothetical protein
MHSPLPGRKTFVAALYDCRLAVQGQSADASAALGVFCCLLGQKSVFLAFAKYRISCHAATH